MKAAKLSAVWEAPDNSRLMKKQTSVRLATHVEARISALCEMYPAKSKSQIINDLLAAALDEVADGFEFVPGHEREIDFDGRGQHEIEFDEGQRVVFLNKANNFLKTYENELGVDDPQLFMVSRWRKVSEK